MHQESVNSFEKEAWEDIGHGIIDQNAQEMFPLFTSDPLLLAANAGDCRMIQALVAQGLDVNRQGDLIMDHMSALHLASRKGTLACVEYLLAGGANISARDIWGKTPLHYASQLGLVAVLEPLIGYGASTEDRDYYWLWTALHWAADNCKDDAIVSLIDYGAKLDSVDRRGQTPLHLLAARGCLTAMASLVNRGAFLGVRDYEGQTAHQVAVSAGQEYSALFLSAAAQHGVCQAAALKDPNASSEVHAWSAKASGVDSKAIATWTVDEVALFLDSSGLAAHEPGFRARAINGSVLLQDGGRLVGDTESRQLLDMRIGQAQAVHINRAKMAQTQKNLDTLIGLVALLLLSQLVINFLRKIKGHYAQRASG